MSASRYHGNEKKALRDLRKHLNKSQSQIAEVIGINVNCISSAERGLQGITITHWKRLVYRTIEDRPDFVLQVVIDAKMKDYKARVTSKLLG
jgi:transcriptional regulator with XRE-family HTH domain